MKEHYQEVLVAADGLSGSIQFNGLPSIAACRSLQNYLAFKLD